MWNSRGILLVKEYLQIHLPYCDNYNTPIGHECILYLSVVIFANDNSIVNCWTNKGESFWVVSSQIDKEAPKLRRLITFCNHCVQSHVISQQLSVQFGQSLNRLGVTATCSGLAIYLGCKSSDHLSMKSTNKTTLLLSCWPIKFT